MTSSLILKGFNTHFEEFLNDIQSVFPEDVDILALKNSLNMVRKTNPRLIIEGWYQHITLQYSTEIEAGNIDFFINKDYSDDILKGSSSDKIISKINLLKKPISDMGEENQAKSMKYIQNLCKLSKVYHLTQ